MGSRWTRVRADQSAVPQTRLGGGPSRRRLLGWTAGGAATLAGAALLPARPIQSAQNVQPQGVVGAWRLRIRDEAPDGPQEERALSTFFADGTFLESSEPGSSTGHGVWVQVDAATYALTFEFLGFEGAAEGPPEPSVIITVRAEVRLAGTGDAFTGVYRADVRLPDGTTVDTGSGTVEATRITVERL